MGCMDDMGEVYDTEIRGEHVTLTVPPYSGYLRTVRLVAADTALRAGLDCDEVEDFRIAVDELCHLLMRSTDHELTVSLGAVGSSVVAHGAARRREGATLVGLDELSSKILESVTDWFETCEQGTEVNFSVLKRPWALARRS